MYFSRGVARREYAGDEAVGRWSRGVGSRWVGGEGRLEGTRDRRDAALGGGRPIRGSVRPIARVL